MTKLHYKNLEVNTKVSVKIKKGSSKEPIWYNAKIAEVGESAYKLELITGDVVLSELNDVPVVCYDRVPVIREEREAAKKEAPPSQFEKVRQMKFATAIKNSDTLEHITELVHRNIDTMDNFNTSMLLHRLGIWHNWYGQASVDLIKFISEKVVQKGVDTYESRACSSMLYGMAKGFAAKKNPLFPLLVAVMRRHIETGNTNGVEISNACWACAKAEDFDLHFFNAVVSYCMLHKFKDFKPQEIANTVNVIVKANMLIPALCDIVTDLALKNIGAYKNSETCNMAYAIVTATDGKDQRLALEVIKRCYEAKLSGYNSHDLANLVHVYKVANPPIADNSFLIRGCKKATKHISLFDSSDINLLLSSLYQLKLIHPPLLDALRTHIEENRSVLHKWDVLDIIHIIRHMGRMGYQGSADWLKYAIPALEKKYKSRPDHELMLLLWGLATLAAIAPDAPRPAIAHLFCKILMEREFSSKAHKAALYTSYLALKSMKLDVSLIHDRTVDEMRSACIDGGDVITKDREYLLNVMSGFQNNVGVCLQSLGHEVKYEILIHDLWIDIQLGDGRLIETDGPSHYFELLEKPGEFLLTGQSLLKTAILSNFGHDLIRISTHETEKLTHDQKMKLISDRVGPASAPAKVKKDKKQKQEKGEAQEPEAPVKVKKDKKEKREKDEAQEPEAPVKVKKDKKEKLEKAEISDTKEAAAPVAVKKRRVIEPSPFE